MDKKSITHKIAILLAAIFIIGFISAVGFKFCLKLDRLYGQIDPESQRLVYTLGTKIESGESPEALQKALVNVSRKDRRFGDLIIINRDGTIIAAKDHTAIGKTFPIEFITDRAKGMPVPFTYKQSGYSTRTNPDNLFSLKTDPQYMFDCFGGYRSPNNTSYYIMGNYHVQNNVLLQRNKLMAFGYVFDKAYRTCLFAFWLLLPIWVYLDAKKRGYKAVAWGILVLFASVIGWVVYLIARPQTVICPVCQCEQTVNQKYCSSCGIAMKNVCSQCGAEVNSLWQYCGECGRKVEE